MDSSDIELGDEPLEVERQPGAGAVVSVRLTAEEAAQLQNLAERQRTTTTRVARQIIGEYLENGPDTRTLHNSPKRLDGEP